MRIAQVSLDRNQLLSEAASIQTGHSATTKIAEPRRSANRVAKRTPGLFYRPYEDIIFLVCVKENSLNAQEFSQALAVHGMLA